MSTLVHLLRAFLIAILAVWPGFSFPAFAHTTSETHSAWQVKGNQVHLHCTVPDLASNRIQRDGDMTTIWLNGQLVVDHMKMENYWDYSKPLPAKGNIELQYHGDKLYWKNIYARDLK